MNNNCRYQTLIRVPADMPAGPKKSYEQPHNFQILSAFCMTFELAISQLTYHSALLYLVLY